MSCAEFAPLLELLPLIYDEGDELLEPAERAALEAHLADCDACTQRTEDYRAAYASLAAAQEHTMQPLSDALRERVLAQHESKLKTLDAAPSFDPERVAALRGQIALSCSFCRDTLERESSVYCAGCLAPHHAECFAEHGRCTMPGCEETRAVQPAVLEAPHRRHERRWRLRLAAPLVALAVGGGIAALTTAEPDLVAEGRRAREGGSTFADSDVVVVEDAPPPLEAEGFDATLSPGGMELTWSDAGELTVLAEGADLRVLLAQIGELSGLNAVIDPRVGPMTVSCSLDKTPPKLALDLICSMLQLEAEALPGAVWISQPPKVTLSVERGDVHTVLSLVGAYAGKNLLLDPRLTGTVSVDFKEVHWLTALHTVIDSLGAHAYSVGPDTVLVTQAELPAEVVMSLRPDSLSSDLPGIAADPQVSLDVEDVPLDVVAEALSAQARINVIVEPGLDAKVSCSLRSVPWTTALLVLQRLSGCGVEVRSDDLVRLSAPPNYALRTAGCDARSVYKLLAAEAGLNLILSDALGGLVDVDLQGLEPLVALRAVAALQGHSVSLADQIVRVAPGHWPPVAPPSRPRSDDGEATPAAKDPAQATLPQTLELQAVLLHPDASRPDLAVISGELVVEGQACRDGRFDVLAIESDRVELRDSESEQGFVRKLYD